MIVDPRHADRSAHKGRETLRLSDAGGLTQFGVYLETLAPGASSSERHWHEAEDEFLYVLDGVATVHDDDGMHTLGAQDAACWRHGDANAHRVLNQSQAPLRYLIVGSRAAKDVCHYPDSGRRQVNSTTRWQVLAADGTIERSGDLPAKLMRLQPVWGEAYDAAKPARRIVTHGSVAGQTGTSYPDIFSDLGQYEAFAISDAGGLTQFGAITERLMPGARSSQRHWHEAEDEFLYVLDGTVTVWENDGPHDLGPGGCAAWPKGVANGHCLENRGTTPTSYFIAGAHA
ncbi:cupin domain-containing protein [Phaeovulum sp.]|uniref:cupin domain-containing protein n=1 Tax=Phaeovulum sp. TaxID=2934796 RepID=UPI0035675016